VRDRHAWLRRLESAERSRSSLSAYRHEIDDLLAWAERVERTGELFEEQAIIGYLHVPHALQPLHRPPTTADSFCFGGSWGG
jgi:hypothetical protein